MRFGRCGAPARSRAGAGAVHSNDAHNIPGYPINRVSIALRDQSARRPSVASVRWCVRVMERFVSNVTLRLDSKGRVSIPASFRSALARDGFAGLYCYPALDRPAIDAGGNALMAEIEALIARYAPFSEEREQFALALYGASETLKIDGEGRIALTDTLKSHAGIASEVAFVGLGHKFQIWEPGRFRRAFAEATQKVRTLKEGLGSQAAARSALGARE